MEEPDRAVAVCAALLFTGRVEWLTWHRRLPVDRRPSASRPAARAVHLMGAVGALTQGRLDDYETARSRVSSLRTPGVVDPFDEVADAWRARLLSLEGRHREAIDVGGFSRPA